MRHEQTFAFIPLRKKIWILVALMLLACSVLIGGIKQNLPYVPEVDEIIFVRPAIQIASTGSLNPGWFGNPGSTTIYPLPILYHLWGVMGENGSLFHPNPDLSFLFSRNITPSIIIGRLLSITYAVLSIPLTYLVGSVCFDSTVGLIGSFLIIFCGIIVQNAQAVRADSAALFWSMLSHSFILTNLE